MVLFWIMILVLFYIIIVFWYYNGIILNNDIFGNDQKQKGEERVRALGMEQVGLLNVIC